MAEVKAIARFCSPTGARALVAVRRLRRVPHARALGTPARCNATQLIQVGDTLPEATLIEKQSEEVKIRDLFAGKLGVLLGMPGGRRAVSLTTTECPEHSRATRSQARSRRAAPRYVVARHACIESSKQVFADA